MKAVTWQGKRKVQVDNVPDPSIEHLYDAADPLGVDTFATHRLSLAVAPEAYETFQA
jgi:hypothetical protein